MANENVREKLHKAIKKHSGMDDEQIIDAGQHGADAGWPGFTYYTDTVKFYDKYEDEIWELLEEETDSMGAENVLALIGSFGGAKNVSDAKTFKNLLSWFALEEVGRWLESAKEA